MSGSTHILKRTNATQPVNQGPNGRIFLGKRTTAKPCLEYLENGFLASFLDNLSSSECTKLANCTYATIGQIQSNGGQPRKPEAVLAAHTYNHAKERLMLSYPGTDRGKLRKLAATDKYANGLVSLLDSTTQYLKEVKRREERR